MDGEPNPAQLLTCSTPWLNFSGLFPPLRNGNNFSIPLAGLPSDWGLLDSPSTPQAGAQAIVCGHHIY
jgi:hypothetical protein